MAVRNEEILNKMFLELEKAHNNRNDDIVMKRQVSRIKLLCELILEQDVTMNNEKQIDTTILENKPKKSEVRNDMKEIDTESDPYSIFDF